MKLKSIISLVATLVSCGIPFPCHAQVLASRSFDLLFQGDDPTESYEFLLPADPLVPATLQFDGFFENLNPDETGVRYGISWHLGNNLWDGIQFTDEMGLRLPGEDPLLGTTRVPVQFEQWIDLTPSATLFWVEGLGPVDRFRFVGEFTIQAVPEPSVITLLIGAALAGFFHRCAFKGKAVPANKRIELRKI